MSVAASPAGSRAHRVPRRFFLPAAVALAVVLVYPLLSSIALALTDSSLARPLQEFTGLENLSTALGSEAFRGSVALSVGFALAAATLSVALGSALAVLLHARGTRFGLVGTLLLLPLVTPPVAVGVAWKLLLAPVGGALTGLWSLLGVPGLNPLGTGPGAVTTLLLVHVWQWTPLVVLLVFAALLGMPQELLEAAALDGAGPLRTLVSVTWPVIAPAVVSALVLELVIAFKVFDLVAVVTAGGPGRATLVASFEVFRTALRGSFDVGTAAAMTLVLGVVVGAVTAVAGVAHRRAVEAES